ncbi:uncharacterized protein EV420DRAFT_1636718 [Desarmillaria tabescens]|uniref:Uncharacterized protein n=1 Tax=Armillaria tabescens TaxID=1929756 RepID=A0AA39NI75_ARMTA|nr:uncharacterized protein EV420DRAFT_1636718 [Desarmillaria tabescens]KAK0466113.1 hypothetical protein EV420DRAFT_1636718 [Desarmillaria tabescens]
MSLPLYRANESIIAALRGDDFKRGYREVVSKLKDTPSRLSRYNSTEIIMDNFTVDYRSSDDFAFVANGETGEEEVFDVSGVISEARLPPVLKSHRVSMNELMQTVKLVGPEDDQDFHMAGYAMSHMIEFLQQSVGTPVQALYGIQHSTAREFTFTNRLLMPAHSAFPEDIVVLPSSYNPSETLQSAIGEGKFAYTKDNQVSYEKFSVTDENE